MSKGWEWINRQPVTPTRYDQPYPIPQEARSALRDLVAIVTLRLKIARIADALGLDGDGLRSDPDVEPIIERIESLQYELARHRGLHQDFGGKRPRRKERFFHASAEAALRTSMDRRG